MSTDYPGAGTVKYDDPGQGPAGAVPNLGARTVVGIFDRLEDVDGAAVELQRAGIDAKDVSILRKGEGTPPQLNAGDTQAGAGAVAGAGMGAAIGGVIGLTALAATGVGALFAAGPIVAALSGALTGGALGALAGSMVGLGIPTERAQRYEDAVRAGGIFVAVKTDDPEAAERVLGVLCRHGARDAESFTPAL